MRPCLKEKTSTDLIGRFGNQRLGDEERLGGVEDGGAALEAQSVRTTAQ